MYMYAIVDINNLVRLLARKDSAVKMWSPASFP